MKTKEMQLEELISTRMKHLKISRSDAEDAVNTYVAEGKRGRFTIRQRKEMYAFSSGFATGTIKLLQEWEIISSSTLQRRLTKYTDTLLSSLQSFKKEHEFADMVVANLIVNEIISNASHLVTNLALISTDRLDAVIDDFRIALMRKIYIKSGDIFILTDSPLQREYWGEHGAHYTTRQTLVVSKKVVVG